VKELSVAMNGIISSVAALWWLKDRVWKPYVWDL